MSLASLKASLSSTESSLSTAKTNAQSSFKTMVLTDQFLQSNYSSFTSTDYTTYTTYKTTNIQNNKIVADLLRDEKSTLDLINLAIQLPGSPTGLRITNTTTTSLTVTFTNESGITSNTITAVPTVGSTVTATFSSGSPYTLTGLSAYTTYTVTISASSSSGSSSASSSVTATTQLSGLSPITSSTSYTTTGSAVVSTSQKYLGSSSLYLPSSGNYVVLSSVPSSSLNGNWSVEFFVYVPGGFVGPGVPLSLGNASGTYFYTEWNSGQCSFYLSDTTVNTWNLMSGVTASYITGWNHVAICSDVIQCTHDVYLNGTRVTSVSALTGRVGTKLTQWNLGSYVVSGSQTGGGNGLYVDTLHVSDCVRYNSSTYTVPTYTLVDIYTVFVNTFEGSNGSACGSASESFYRTFAYNTLGVTVSTSASKFGTASMATTSSSSAAGGYLQVVGLDETKFTGSWTIELWFYPTTTTSAWAANIHQGLFCTGTQGSGGSFLGVVLTGGTSTMAMWAGSYTSFPTDTPTLNSWNHVAMVCNGGTTYLFFLNGTLLSSGTGPNVGHRMSSLNFGAFNNYKQSFNTGYLDEIRVSSTARYTSGFTPSTSAFTSDSDTVFLNHFDGAANGSTNWAAGQESPSAPSMPSNLSVTNTATTSITISFTNDTSTTSNTVTAVPSSGSTVTATFSTGSPYTITGLVSSKSYTISLTASNSAGTSSTTTVSSSTTSATTYLMLLHGDDMTDSGSYTKTVTQTLASTAPVTISTSTYKFGSGSFYFTPYGANQGSLLVPLNISFGTGDFTVDLWFKFTIAPSIGDQHNLYTLQQPGSQTAFKLMWQPSGYTLQGWIGGTPVEKQYATNMDTAWHHVAVERYNSVAYLYLDGSLQASRTHTLISNALSLTTNSIQIGYGFKGYIDEFRIIQSAAYQGQSFTPPTQPYE
jgi:trimeric autotransporter adhesin